jgi:endonuclease/exonuclease/phosphatase family metal-dependent hydrolase
VIDVHVMPTQPDKQIKLVSWNVQKRVSKALERQADALVEEGNAIAVDLVALQEVTRGTIRQWRARLAELGLSHCIDSSDLVPEDRTSINLLASRWPLERMSAAEFEVPFPEKVLSAVVSAPYRAVEVHVAHLPAGVTWPEQKQLTNEAIYKRLARESLRPRILCGDFNAPKEETTGGELVTHAGSRRDEAWSRWDAAERGPLERLRQFGMVDVFRACHGYDLQEASYVGTHRGGRVHRYDHVIASEELQPWSCEYRHSWRQWDELGQGKRRRLSDHSGVIATFSIGPGPILKRMRPTEVDPT